MLVSRLRAAFSGQSSGKFSRQLTFVFTRQLSSLQESYIYGWGNGSEGQLGFKAFEMKGTLLGKEFIQEEPRKLAKSRRFKDIAVGGQFTLAITHDGDLYGWGKNFMGKDSQSNEPVPLKVSTNDSASKIATVAAGDNHACVIDTEGLVYSWGSGGSWFGGGGQLGHGSTDSEEEPKLIKAFAEYDVKAKSVSCGGKHTLILTEDGEVLSCGVGEYGRLGTGSNDDALVPIPLATLADEEVVQIAAGYDHSLILTKDGKIFTWGRNNLGQLGHSDSYIDIYSMEDFPRAIEQESIRPDEIMPYKDPVIFKQIAAGNGRSAGITTDGQLYVWGSRIVHMPRLFDKNQYFGGESCAKVKCGGDSGKAVVAALLESGDLYTFGDGSAKMIGTRSPSMKVSSPQHLEKLSSEGKEVVDISCGFGMHMFAQVKVP